MRRWHRMATMKIKNILTHNAASQLTYRFTSKTRTLSGLHVFGVACKSIDIEHRLSPPRRPQTNAMNMRVLTPRHHRRIRQGHQRSVVKAGSGAGVLVRRRADHPPVLHAAQRGRLSPHLRRLQRGPGRFGDGRVPRLGQQPSRKEALISFIASLRRRGCG